VRERSMADGRALEHVFGGARSAMQALRGIIPRPVAKP